MAVVFVSHANADQDLVDEFVDLVLRVGCGLAPEDIFYSSGADTGVLDGQDLLSHVRKQVTDTGLVVAMLTPTFQTRPVCVAELGAAWGHTGGLFPLLVPGMKRAELEGVLSTQLVEYMDNEGALARLHDRIVKLAGNDVSAATWTRASERWIKRLHSIVEEGVARPLVVTPAEHQKVVARCEALAAALEAAEEDIERLRQERDAVAALKDPDQVAAALLPTKAAERFEAVVGIAQKALSKVGNRYVAEAIVAEFSDNGGLTMPNDQWERDQVIEAAAEGLLHENDGLYSASDTFPSHERAKTAVHQAITSMPDDPDFDDWFTSRYEARPKMKNLRVLKAVFLD